MTSPRSRAERLIPDGAFAGDTGAADPAVTTALASYAKDPTSYAEALSAVQASRLLVPVVALLGEVEYDDQGRAHDKTSEMAAVLLRRSDGRVALLAFTSTQALADWNPEARPVPVAAQIAARSALQDDAAALVVDIAGPVTLVVEGDDLLGLSRGWQLARIGARSTWIRRADH